MKTCKNCESQRRTKLTRGYCQKCYRLTLCKEKIDLWDINDSSGLSYPFPKGDLYRKPEYFQLLKSGFCNQATSSLRKIKTREFQYQNGADGLTIEHMLRRIGERLSGKNYKNTHYGAANRIDWSFPKDQKKELYRLLMELEETAREPTFSLSKILLTIR